MYNPPGFVTKPKSTPQAYATLSHSLPRIRLVSLIAKIRLN